MNATHENSTLSLHQQRASGTADGFRFAVWSLLKASAKPMTDRELMDALQQSDPNNIRPEITRLKHDGLVRECGKTKCQTTGKQVRITTVTPAPYKTRTECKAEREEFHLEA